MPCSSTHVICEATYRSAALLHQLGRLEEALVHFDLCDELRPHHAPTLGSRALVLRDMKRFEEYLAGGRRAHALDRKNAEICNNIGDALLLLGRFGQALDWFERAFKLRPSFRVALENKALVLRRMHRFDEVLTIISIASSPCDPTYAQSRVGFGACAICCSEISKLAGGKREARWRIPDFPSSFAGWTRAGLAWGEKHRGKDHPDLLGRGAWGRDTVHALRTDAGSTRCSGRPRRSGSAATLFCRHCLVCRIASPFPPRRCRLWTFAVPS